MSIVLYLVCVYVKKMSEPSKTLKMLLISVH